MSATIILDGSEKLLQLTQYGIRRQMALPSVVFALTRRESVGTTRTFTAAAAHGLAVGDRVRVDGIDGNYNDLFVVATVPTPTTFTTTASTAFTEAETSATGGLGLSFKWKRLRLGIRLALPCNASWDAGSNLCAMGLSVGTHPFQLGECEFFRGSVINGALSLYPYNGFNFLQSESVNGFCPVITKRGATVTTRSWLGYEGNNFRAYFSGERRNPSVWLMEFHLSAGYVRQTNGWITASSAPTLITSEGFKNYLRDVAPLEQSGSNITRQSLNLTTANWGALDFTPLAGAPKCFELLWQPTAVPIELLDVGYAILE